MHRRNFLKGVAVTIAAGFGTVATCGSVKTIVAAGFGTPDTYGIKLWQLQELITTTLLDFPVESLLSHASYSHYKFTDIYMTEKVHGISKDSDSNQV
jgi:hypothetical protein